MLRDRSAVLAAIQLTEHTLSLSKAVRDRCRLDVPTSQHIAWAKEYLAPLRERFLVQQTTPRTPYDRFGFVIEPSKEGLHDECDRLHEKLKSIASDWFEVCGARGLQRKDPDGYNRCLQQGLITTSPSVEAINKDMPRTFPSNKYFQDPLGPQYTTMRQVLTAFSAKYSDGYCQGMNFITAALILILGPHKAEEIFWILSVVVEDARFNEGYYSLDMHGIRVDQIVMNRLVESLFPDVFEKLNVYGITIGDICVRWFLTLCIDAIPFHNAMLYVDHFFRMGSEAHFCLTLGLVAMSATTLRSANELGDIMDCFRLDRLQNIQEVFESGMNLKAVNTEKLKEMRKDAKAELQRQIAEREARRAQQAALKSSGGKVSASPTKKDDSAGSPSKGLRGLFRRGGSP